MALSHSPRIVTDGLVLCLDAGNTKSYVGSGTTWRDLSGRGNTGTLTNGPTYSSSNGGSIVFDGVDDYVTIPSSTDYEFGTGDFTIEWWQYIESFVSQYFAIIHANANGANSSSNASIGIRYESSGSYLRVGGNGVSTVDFTSLTTSTGVWTHCALVRTGSTLKFFVNTTQVGGDKTFTSNVSTASPSNSTGYIGGAYFGGGSGTLYSNNGKISNLRVYRGKGLTASEVSQNFNALRGRFGI
jgi:hypothetical protein